MWLWLSDSQRTDPRKRRRGGGIIYITLKETYLTWRQSRWVWLPPSVRNGWWQRVTTMKILWRFFHDVWSFAVNGSGWSRVGGSLRLLSFHYPSETAKCEASQSQQLLLPPLNWMPGAQFVRAWWSMVAMARINQENCTRGQAIRGEQDPSLFSLTFWRCSKYP